MVRNMEVKCEYCGSLFSAALTKCPNCGAQNDSIVRTAADQPHTIDELIQWYKSKGLPPYNVTRFFIGENYKGERAFGIYHDTDSGNIVVYKNTSSGKRCVHYEGSDEEYAVNEMFQRLKAEILQQKMLNAKKK